MELASGQNLYQDPTQEPKTGQVKIGVMNRQLKYRKNSLGKRVDSNAHTDTQITLAT